MVQNNKVLTVSYGTFSCTLEGFDDSFETMKAIAEYFRDLSADDRYFGSEPPQPDTEMLARIAKRDLDRQIETRQSDSGLVLRATEVNTPQLPETGQSDVERDIPAQQPEEPENTPTVDAAGFVAPSASAPVSEIPTSVAEPASADEDDIEPVEAEIVADAEPAPQETELKAAPAAPSVDEAEPMDETVARPVAADSIAAKLQRIRAVVSRNDGESGAYSEDEHADAMTAKAATPVDAISAAFESQPADTETTTATPSKQIFGTEPSDDDSDGFLFSGLDEASEAEDADDDMRNILGERQQDDEPEAENADLAATQPAEDETAPDTPQEEEDVIKPDPLAEGALTAEDEAALLRELASVEAELIARTEDHQSQQSDGDTKEDDLSRLLATADEKLDDPSSAGNREAYTHLRAAVVATQAEKSEKGDDDEQARDDEYREDLATAVSPQRPEAGSPRARPNYDRPGPLKLVAEQRVDTETNELNDGPVRPRRVTAEAEDNESESGFACFAEEHGAQSLPELLEAAASYLSFVEGQEQFSRPQLMNKVRALKHDGFNREDSLRSFGQLLRDGKIEKAGGGRFAASKEIGFRPDDKRAVG